MLGLSSPELWPISARDTWPYFSLGQNVHSLSTLAICNTDCYGVWSCWWKHVLWPNDLQYFHVLNNQSQSSEIKRHFLSHKKLSIHLGFYVQEKNLSAGSQQACMVEEKNKKIFTYRLSSLGVMYACHNMEYLLLFVILSLCESALKSAFTLRHCKTCVFYSATLFPTNDWVILESWFTTWV